MGRLLGRVTRCRIGALVGVIVTLLALAPAAFAQTGQINGKVTNGAATPVALANIEVDLYDSSQNFLTSTSTAADGSYSFTSLATGKYLVGFQDSTNLAYMPQYYNGQGSLATATAVTVTDGAITHNINAKLVPASNITGKVTNSAATPVALANVEVDVYDSGGNFLTSTSTATDGTYTFAGIYALTAGTYRIGFQDPSGTYLAQFYSAKASLATATAITVGAGATVANVNAKLITGGVIKGTVTNNAATPTKLANIEVDLYDSSGGQLNNTTTAADGSYSIGGLQTGTYHVGFQDSAGQAYVAQFFNGQATLTAATPISVTAGTTTANINAKLVPASNITGKVTNSAATPVALANVEVDVYDSGGNFLTSTSTATDGTYTFAGIYALTAGTYRIGFQDPSGTYLAQFYSAKASLATATAITVGAGATVANVNAKLITGGVIKGTVTNNAATPTKLANIEVDLYDSSGGQLNSTTTAADGSYSIGGLQTGTYHVGFQDSAGQAYVAQFFNGQATLTAATPISVTAGTTTANINAKLVPASNITGKVTNSAATPVALANVEVDLYDSSDSILASTTTNSSGTYTFARVYPLAAGTYRIGFRDNSGVYLPQFYTGQATLATATAITVGAGATVANVNAKLITGGVIKGTVTNNAATPAPLPNIEVLLYNSADEPLTSTRTASNGAYSFTGLQTGKYLVAFEDTTNAAYASQFYAGQATAATATKVSVTAATTTANVNAKLVPASKITGKVTNSAATPAPLANIEVDLFDANDNRLSSTLTTSTGTYTFAGTYALGAGTYKIGFRDSGSGLYLPQFYSGKANLASATPIAVGASATVANVNAALTLGGSITGKAINVSQIGLPGIVVTVYDNQGSEVGSTTTSSTGVYTVAGLAPGLYEVGFFDPADTDVSYFYSGAHSIATATQVAVKAATATTNISQVLPVGGTISGTVTDSSNHPLAGVVASVYDASGGIVVSATTNSSGAYSVAGLNAGAYEVGFTDLSGHHISVFYSGKASIVSANTVDVATSAPTTNVNQKMASSAPPPATGAISGLVTDSGGHTLAGVEVTVFDSSGNFVNSGQTGSAGTYTISGLPTGSYKAGFFPTGNYLPQYYNGASSLTSATAVSVAAPNTTPNINAKLATGGQITGKVTGSGSPVVPLGGVAVTVYSSAGNQLQVTTTATNGTYGFSGLPSGTYKVGFNAFGTGYLPQYYNGKSSLATATAITVTAGAVTPGINAQLLAGGGITGVVTNGASAPQAGIDVELFDSSGTQLASTATNYDGSYSFMGLATGSYKIGFSLAGGDSFLSQYYNGASSLASATAVPVTAGAVVSAINAKLVAVGRVTGLVNDSLGYPLSGITVNIYDGAGNVVAASSTGGDGTYSVDVTAAGSYRVGFLPPPGNGGVGSFLTQYYSGKATLATANPISVTLGATTPNVNATLQRAGEISGTVTDVAGHPLAGVNVTVYSSGSSVAAATTAQGGTYAVGGLPAGTYQVGFDTGSGANYTPVYYAGKSTLATATPVAVTAGAVTPNINAQLSGRAQIKGTVTNSAAAGIGGAVVTVYNSAGQAIATATTTSNGTYTATMLDGGTYRVGFSASGYATQYYNQQATLTAANGVSVPSGGTVTAINAQLTASGAISGTVTNNAATPVAIAGVTVTVYNSAGTSVAATTTSSTGTYTVTGLPPGTGAYRAGFVKTGYLTQYYNNQATLAAANAITVNPGATTPAINAKLAP